MKLLKAVIIPPFLLRICTSSMECKVVEVTDGDSNQIKKSSVKYCNQPVCGNWREIQVKRKANKVGLWSQNNPVPLW